MSGSPSDRRVLVIDDDPVILRAYGQRLRAEGYEVGTASDGASAVAIAVQQEWDILLIDARLPGRSGADVIRVLRSRREFAATPIWVLSLPGDADLVEQAIRAGGDGSIDKSRMAPRDLADKVEDILSGQARSQRAPSGSSIGASQFGGSPAESRVPPAVEEIVRRLRPGSSPAPRPAPVGARAAVAAPAASAVSPPVVPQQSRERWDESDSDPGSTRSGHGGASYSTAPGATQHAQNTISQTFDVVLNRVVGQPSQLAAALGFRSDYSCPICAGPLVLRLRVDSGMEFGVRGHFYCPGCAQNG